VITKTLTEYATKPVTPPPTFTDNTPTSSSDGKKEEDNKGFTTIKGALEEIIPLGLDKAKQKKYKSAEARVLFMISKYIDQFDQEHVKPFYTTKERWDSLY